MYNNLSYSLKGFLVRDFGGKSWTSAREGSEIFQIPDIGEVTQDDARRKLKNAIMIGVVQLDSCFHCKAKVEPITPPMG